MVASMRIRPCQSGSGSSVSATAGQGTASNTRSAAAASVTEAASAPMPWATGVRACGPRALESFTRWPAPITRRPTARPTCPAPRIPICILAPKIQQHRADVVLTMCSTAAVTAHVPTLVEWLELSLSLRCRPSYEWPANQTLDSIQSDHGPLYFVCFQFFSRSPTLASADTDTSSETLRYRLASQRSRSR